MKRAQILMAVILLLIAAGIKPVYAQELETVKSFDSIRPGNPAVTPLGEIFLTMSALSNPEINVNKLTPDGTLIPFPSEKWASRPKRPDEEGIVKAIGIKASRNGEVWILDMGELPEYLPKLVSFDAHTGELRKKIDIPQSQLRKHPFLQDFVIDEKRNKIYIADMDFNTDTGMSEKPAILVADLQTGNIQRKLEAHPSTMPLMKPIIVNGKKISSRNSKGESVIHYYGLNPISIDEDSQWVYYGAMSGEKIYRISAKLLADKQTPDDKIEKAIQFYAPKPFSDGFIVHSTGDVYVGDIQRSAIGISSPSGYRIVVQDKKKLKWPDGFSIQDGWLYVTANELNTLPGLNNGMDESTPPYYLNRLKIGK